MGLVERFGQAPRFCARLLIISKRKTLIDRKSVKFPRVRMNYSLASRRIAPEKVDPPAWSVSLAARHSDLSRARSAVTADSSRFLFFKEFAGTGVAAQKVPFRIER